MRTTIVPALLAVAAFTAHAQDAQPAPAEAAPAAVDAAPAPVAVEAAPAAVEAAPVAEAAPAATEVAPATAEAEPTSFTPEVVAASETSSDTVNVVTEHQYIAVMPGFFMADKDRGGKARGITASGIYGYRFSPHWGVELNLMGSSIETGKGSGTDFYQEGGTVDLVYGFNDRSISWTPFVLLGIGAIYNDVVPNSEDKAGFIANAGIGAVSRPIGGSGIKLRGEARYQRDEFQDGYNDYRFLAGIEVPFGSRSVAVAAAAAPQVEIREVVKEVFVPAPFVDSDKDTVEDSRDKCADTPEGLKVDSNGCVIIGQALELKGVTFEFDSAKLQLNAQTVLDYVVKGMKGQPSMQVEIAGYTDSKGAAAYNLKLSQRRAEAVSAYVAAQGIDASRLTSKGYGETMLLVTPEQTDVDYERNRRVVFNVTAN